MIFAHFFFKVQSDESEGCNPPPSWITREIRLETSEPFPFWSAVTNDGSSYSSAVLF